MTSRQIGDRIMSQIWDTVREGLIADYEEHGREMPCPVPTWDEMEPRERKAFSDSMVINDVMVLITAIMRTVAEVANARQASKDRRN